MNACMMAPPAACPYDGSDAASSVAPEATSSSARPTATVMVLTGCFLLSLGASAVLFQAVACCFNHFGNNNK